MINTEAMKRFWWIPMKHESLDFIFPLATLPPSMSSPHCLAFNVVYTQWFWVQTAALDCRLIHLHADLTAPFKGLIHISHLSLSNPNSRILPSESSPPIFSPFSVNKRFPPLSSSSQKSGSCLPVSFFHIRHEACLQSWPILSPALPEWLHTVSTTAELPPRQRHLSPELLRSPLTGLLPLPLLPVIS